ncbi:hypothetical protein GCM10022286_22570 [Gryllotalpicola daejeonensis]|uniref:DUF559 domain-containing protein n=1 Tax=Gryllotalpicola daejeonensis TaxID=993087 RepID=A0ABP7ZLD3_9MICO
MRRRTPLPDSLVGRAFSIEEAREAGVSPARLSGNDLSTPHRGVRAPAGERTHGQRREDYTVRIVNGEYFSHITAAELFGVPLPAELLAGPVHVSMFRPQRARQVRGVIHHELEPRGQLAGHVSGVPVLHPAFVWVQLAGLLSLDDLIIAGDFLVTGSEPFDERPPLTTIDELRSAVAQAPGSRGIRAARAALEEIRYGCLSPQETRLRLLIERAGLPAPELNHRIYDERGSLVAMLDGAFPEHFVGYEYMGDHHRTKKSTYRNDMLRRARVEDLGWSQLDISSDDLELRPLETLARIARRLHSAGATLRPIEYGVDARKRRR